MEYIIIGLLLFIVFLLITNVNERLNKIEKGLKNIKVTLDQVANVIEVPEHPINDELRKLLKEGKEILAIKEARTVLGLSLLEAKQYVDEL